MDTHVSTELNYKPAMSIAPSYKMTQLVAREGTSDVTLLAGQLTNVFEIRGDVFNLAQSNLYFDYKIGLQANKFINCYADTIPQIQMMELVTGDGKQLCYINNFAQYVKVMLKGNTHIDDYLQNDDTNILKRCNGANSSGSTTGTFSNGRIQSGAAGAGGGFVSAAVATAAGDVKVNVDGTFGADRGAVTGSVSASTNVNALRYSNDAVSLSYTENKYIFRSALGGDLTVQYRFKLGELKKTIFALNKDLFFNQTIFLRITWGNKYLNGWTTDAANLNPDTLVDASAQTISNLYLYLAKEKNPSVIADIMAKYASPEGLPPIIYENVIVDKTNRTASTNQTVSRIYSIGDGVRLKSITYSVFPNDETKNQTFDTNNINGSKVVSFRSLLNNERLYEFDVQCTTASGLDYMLMKPYLKKSVIQDRNQYQYNWHFSDCFDAACGPDEQDKFSTVSSGLALSQAPLKYDIYATTVNAAFNHYLFSVVERRIQVSQSMGVMLA